MAGLVAADADVATALRYVTRAGPLFLHQYSHAWIDFRRWRDPEPPHDWFANSVTATRANQRYCLSLRDRVPRLQRDVVGHHRVGRAQGLQGLGRAAARSAGRRHGRAVRRRRLADVGAGITLPALRQMQAPLRRSALRPLRLRRRVPSHGRLDQPGRDRHRPRHHAAVGRERAHGQRVEVVHGQPRDPDAMRRAGFDAGSVRPRVDGDDRRRRWPRGHGTSSSERSMPAAVPRYAPRSPRRRALADRFEAHTFAAPDGITLPYRLLPPPSPPSAGERVPLVLVLHGSGEIGTDNRAQLTPFALVWATRRGTRPRPRLRARPADAGAIGQLLGTADRRRAHLGGHAARRRDAGPRRPAGRHAADRSPAHRRDGLLDGRLDDLEPAARAPGLVQRGDPDRRACRAPIRRPRSGRRRGSG